MQTKKSFAKSVLNGFIALLVLSFSNLSTAQHSDIWITLENGQIVVSPTNLQTGIDYKIDATTGLYLATGNFDDFGQGTEGTDDPGFQSQDGVFPSIGAWINYRAVGKLWFWDGDNWVNSVPNQEEIRIEDQTRATAIIRPDGVDSGNCNPVPATGLFDCPEGHIQPVVEQNNPPAGGLIHQHVDYFVASANTDPLNDDPTPGAYMFDLELYATDTGLQGNIVYTASEPFRIALKYQIDQAEFDEAIAALTDPVVESVNVPVPFIALLSLAGFFVIVVKLGRNQQRL